MRFRRECASQRAPKTERIRGQGEAALFQAVESAFSGVGAFSPAMIIRSASAI